LNFTTILKIGTKKNMSRLIIISFFVLLVGCSTSTIVSDIVRSSDPCQIDIQHPDVLKCLQDSVLDNYDTDNKSDFETLLCNCKKEFIKKNFSEENKQ